MAHLEAAYSIGSVTEAKRVYAELLGSNLSLNVLMSLSLVSPHLMEVSTAFSILCDQEMSFMQL